MLPAPRTLVLLGALLAACGAEPVNYAELEDICGAPSPVRVLALAPDQTLRDGPPIRVGDRVFYVISHLNDGDSDLPYSPTAESTVWTTGPCGESPRQVGAGIEHIFVLDRWPDLVLGCHKATGDVVVLDPDGDAGPHPLFPGVPREWSCGLAWTEHGLLSVLRHDDELGALQLHPYPDDPRTGVSNPEILLDPIRVTPVPGGLGRLQDLLYSFPDHALALTPDGVLTRVDLADRQVSTVQTGVIAFDASRDGRLLLWQDATRTGGDAERPEGKLLPDGAVLGAVGLDRDWLGALVLIEPGSSTELRIDDHVHGHAIDTARTSDEGVVRYSVSDGERSGVYLARLPPRG